LIASAGATTVAELAKKLQLSPAETRGMVVRLTEAEVLTRDEGQEKCRFQVEMFRRWVARHAIRSGIDVS
jgi:DNA-binding IclR family transcriptional regulator